MQESSYLIGRQPILDRLEKIAFYELLFRSQESPGSASIKNSIQATSRVVVNSLSGFKLEDVLGIYRGLINVDVSLLLSDTIELLPPKMMGLELLDLTEITSEVIERCRELKSRGYVIVLDDHVYSPEYEELYKGIIDIVKIDLIKTPLERVYQMVDSLKRYPLKLLAENVETRHVYLRSRSMGFELFQGFFFSRPSTLQKKRLSDSTHTFFKLMQQLQDDSDIAGIENTFKLSPALTYKLLLLVNSVSVGCREKIRTVTHAITLIGLEQLKRWVQLALFASDDSQDLDNPLMDMVAVRAAFMERLAMVHPGTCLLPDAAAEAFMAGTLSLLGDCYGFTVDEMIEGLNLSEVIQNALVRREGALGELLTITELIERFELEEATNLLNRIGIPLIKVLECQNRAFGWREGFR
jgi:EAL and modified HD-GYP domain-containing signal transduction protein